MNVIKSHIVLLSLVFYWSVQHGTSAATVVVPNTNASVEGDVNNLIPFSVPDFGIVQARYQQVYRNDAFNSLNPAGEYITHISFRPDGFGSAFTSSLPDIKICLSTTPFPPDALHTYFAENVGPDVEVVWPRGPLHLSSKAIGQVGTPREFDIVIPLARPFFYRPQVGHLLLEVQNFDLRRTTAFDAAELSGDSVSRIRNTNDVNAATGTLYRSTIGLVTQFRTTTSPVLFINGSGTNVALSWPRAASNFVVESTVTLAATNNWSPVTNAPVHVSNWAVVTNVTDGARRFYRLRLP